MSEPEKLCRKCGEWWPRDHEFFFRKTETRDGWDNACRACVAEKPSRTRSRSYMRPLVSPWEKLFTETRA